MILWYVASLCFYFMFIYVLSVSIFLNKVIRHHNFRYNMIW
jgi:hypothetical protein